MPKSDPDDPSSVKGLVRDHWTGRATTFDDEPQHGIHSEAQYDRWTELLGTWIGSRPRSVLDVGCGTGVISAILADIGHDVTGLDLAPAMLREASEKLGDTDPAVPFVLGDAERLPLATDSMDAVCGRHVVWTLPHPTEALAEWQRVLAPGGRIVLIEGRWDHEEPREQYRNIHRSLPIYEGRSPAAMEQCLSKGGLIDVSSQLLQDPVLWGREPRHDYYIVRGTLPSEPSE